MTSVGRSGHWSVIDAIDAVAGLHSLDVAELAADFAEGGRLVVVCEPTWPALVLGSGQSDADIDERAVSAADIDLVRRRSGGGAVWVHPDDSVWIDIWIPRDDPMWTDDVSASMLFVGDAFVSALPEIGGSRVWREPYVAGPHGRTVCFAGTAPGEVVGPVGKVVGMSQRRDRSGARIQCIAYRRWSPADWSRFFVDAAVREAADALPVTCIDHDVDALRDRLLAALPTS